MGAVYRAHDPSLDRTVALKVVLDQNEQFVARFSREAKAVARLSHPHIVQVYDFGQDEDGNPFFVMELIKGKSLEAVVKDRGPMPPDKVVDILRQAALGLAAAHAAGVIHRDIKPHNMLLDEGGLVKLVDFGIARVSGVNEGLTGTNEALGTLHYMAPEVLSGQQADARADIYSLGLVAFHLLTGKPPFAGESAVAIAMKQISTPLPDLGKVAPATPASLRRLIDRMTVKDRDKRLGSCDEVAREAAVIAEELSRTEPVSMRFPSSGRRILILAGGLGLLTATGLALMLGSRGKRHRDVDPPAKLATVEARAQAASPPADPQPAPGRQKAAAPVDKATGPVRIAVLKWKNLSGDPELNVFIEGISEQTSIAFDELRGKITLLERNQFDEQNLPELMRSKTEYIDPSTAAELGRVLGVEVVVQGSFVRLERQMRVNARFIGVATGEILDQLSLTAPIGTTDEKFAIQDRVAAELRTHLQKLLPRLRPRSLP
jgi:serine/threonine-protein kinase